jgi:predicted amidohydrolase YtcJ
MGQLSRQDFLGLGTVTAAGLAAGCGPGAGAGTEGAPSITPDLVVLNGNVLTQDDADPTAEAFAVKDGPVVAVGSTADVRNLASTSTQVIDAAGATVVPGFIDAHSHPSGAGPTRSGTSTRTWARSRASKPRTASARSARARRVDRRLHVRRPQAGGGAAPQPARPRRRQRRPPDRGRPPRRPDDHGILTMTQEQVHEVVDEAHQAGWQIAIHANGDVAIAMVLNAYERAQRQWPRQDTRHRLEHCTLVNPSLLRRIADGGYIPAPFYTYAHYHGEKWAEYGDARTEWMFAHRSFLDHGIRVAPASDYVPGPYEPLTALQSMVTRKDSAGRVWGPSQRITLAEALKVCTVNGAYASFEEDEKGSITAGKLADFVILAEDPHDVDPDRIKEIRVVRTVVGGRTVFEA